MKANISEKILTPQSRIASMKFMQDALQTLVAQALDGRSVREGADLCGLPEHRLRDVVYGKSKRPQPEVLEAIERGLHIPYDRLALAAYGRLTEPVVGAVL